MLSVNHFKAQVQKPWLKRSFDCSAHVQDVILVYLIPKCRETPAMMKALKGNCWASQESGTIEVIFVIRFRLPSFNQFHHLWSDLMTRNNSCIFPE